VSPGEALLDTAFVTVYSPLAKPLSFLVLELVVLASGVLGLRHALRALRSGDRGPLFTWATIFVYGLAMEVLSYNFTSSFVHGQFTVMFYRRQLPLYVTVIYPVLLYTAIATAGRLRLHRAAEPFVAGLLIVAMDVPFDILGPVAGWWSWSDRDPNMAYRWLGVPVTSYYWHFAFGGILAALTRAARPYLTGPRRFLLALPVAGLTIVLGVLSFLPFHLLKALGVADGTVVAGLLGLGVAVLVLAKKTPPGDRDALLLATPVLFYGAHLLFAVVLFMVGLVGFGSRFAAIAVVTGLAAVAHARAHRLGAEPPPTPEPAQSPGTGGAAAVTSRGSTPAP
jgi:hypothetical protein